MVSVTKKRVMHRQIAIPYCMRKVVRGLLCVVWSKRRCKRLSKLNHSVLHGLALYHAEFSPIQFFESFSRPLVLFFRMCRRRRQDRRNLDIASR